MADRDWRDFGIDVTRARSNRAGDAKVICPQCKEKDRSLSINVIKKIGHCLRETCKFVVILASDRKEVSARWCAPVENAGLAWLKSRGISEEVARSHGVMVRNFKREGFPHVTETVAMPMKRYGQLLNICYRRFRIIPTLSEEELKKRPRFWFTQDGEIILINLDCLIHKPTRIYWVEGWLDGLALETVGITNWLSLPTGSPAPGTTNFDGRLRVIDEEFDRIDAVAEHVLLLDNDGPGRTMSEALARRLDVHKCWLPQWPEGVWAVEEQVIKDSGDVLKILGEEKLVEFANKLSPYPVTGIATKTQVRQALSRARSGGVEPDGLIGIPAVDNLLTIKFGYTYALTGPPNLGKTTFVFDLMRRLALKYNWRQVVFEAEQSLSSAASVLVSQAAGVKAIDLSLEEEALWGEWINEHFHFILPDEVKKLEEILEIVSHLVKKFGIRGWVLDPYNKLESRRSVSGMSEIEYLNWSLNLMSDFNKRHNIFGIIVAHPRAISNMDGSTAAMTGYYQVNGGSQWGNIMDVIFAVNKAKQGRFTKYGFLPARLDTFKCREKPELGNIGTADNLWFCPRTKRFYDDSEIEAVAFPEKDKVEMEEYS